MGLNAKKAGKIIREVMDRVGLRAEIELKENRAVATAYNITIRDRAVCDFIMVSVNERGLCLLSAVFGHLEKTVSNLEALNEYNSNALGWRAYIDDSGDLNFDYDNDYTDEGKLKQFLIENIDSFVDDDTEDAFFALCGNCTED